MKRAAQWILLVAGCHAQIALGQVPHIVGTWTLDADRSELPGPPPRSEVRRYYLGDDGFLVGLAVFVRADGNPGFLQFAAKTDGRDYPEYGADQLARFQVSGAATPLTYSEEKVDEYTVRWFDRRNGRVTASGTKSVSRDGQTMTVVAEFPGEGGARTFTYVYRRVAD